MSGPTSGGPTSYGANLSGAHLNWGNLAGADLSGADLEGATIGGTAFADCDLSTTKGLSEVTHWLASTIGTNTLAKSRGRIPEEFLRGCGLSDIDILYAKLHDPELKAGEVCEITDKIAALRMKPLAIGGVFISYSWKDNEKDNLFVDRLYERLQGAGVRVWLDKHEMVAGPVKRQVVDALRVMDVVVLVLSAHSVKSDWVEYELEAARKKEKAENRQVLCPVNLDDAWKGKMDDPLWRQVQKAYVVGFAKWREEAAFEESFGRLLKGMKIYYPGAK